MTHAVLGTGGVGHAVATKLVSLGHTVWMGSRTADNPKATAWAQASGGQAGTFAQAAEAAEVVWLCISGQHALSVAEAAGPYLGGKVLIDLSNPLDFSKGFPPRLFVCNDDSLGEQLQRALTAAKVVKTFNTLANSLMVDPGKLPEPTDTFVAGEDAAAKALVSEVLQSFGHQPPIDMGGIEASRGLEAWLLLWTRLYGVFGTGDFNLRLVR